MLWFIVGLSMLLGVILGWVSFFRTERIAKELQELREQVRKLQLDRLSTRLSVEHATPLPSVAAAPAPRAKAPFVHAVEDAQPLSGWTQAPRAEAPELPPRLRHLQEHWMSWLGGICVGLAGVFLVRYSIEQGLLGPAARIAAGLVSGLALHAAAFWLRMRKGAHPALAALAAGASITLFATLVAALHLYDLFTPQFSFAVMALVALATMWLALLHGPLLAMLGILGAYAVPALVGGDSGHADSVLMYVLVIDAAGLALLRHVDRRWLWNGVFIGSALWWWLTLDAASADWVRGWYLAAFVWLLYAIPGGDWLLRRVSHSGAAGLARYWRCIPGHERLQSAGLAGALAAWTVSVALSRFDDAAFLLWTPFSLLVLHLAGKHQHLTVHAWLAFALTWLAWFAGTGAMTPDDVRLTAFYWYCLGSTAVFMLLALRNIRLGDWQAWQPMLLLAPAVFLVLAWQKTVDAELSLQWSLLAALLGAVHFVCAGQALRAKLPPLATAWFFVAAHLAYSLGVAMYLREASMTLALAVQIISLAWLIRRFELPVMGWVLKGVVMLVVCRLSLNPWLFQYPADVHWSLWTYGGATLCCWLGSRRLDAWPALQAWARGAALHLFVLTLWAELRWWLYDGDVFALQYTALEAGINTSMFAAIGLSYHWRAGFSARLAPLYRLYSALLLGFALYNYVLIVVATWASLPWIIREVGTTRVFNSMLLLFALPVLLGWATARYYRPGVKRAATVFAAVAAFLWVSLEIRHLWQRSISLRGVVLDGELYTYSAVWLVIAVAALLGGAWRFGRACYQSGMALLLLVVVKLFLVDMAGLQGLLRVASFLGMGLALLAVAYLHKRLQPAVQAPSSSISTGM